MCKQHPSLELTHYCEDLKCNEALCVQCVTENHQYHQVQPMKSICETKLSHLKVMGEALELNHQLVQSARKKLEENKSEMHELLRQHVKDWHAELDKAAKRNSNYIDKMVSEAHDLLNVKEIGIRESKVEQKLLEVGFSDTIPNIVKANADKHLDANLSSLYDTINNWNLRCSLLVPVYLNQFKNIGKKWVLMAPLRSVKGAPVALFEPVVPSVKPKAVTSRKRAAPIASTSKKSRQQSSSD